MGFWAGLWSGPDLARSTNPQKRGTVSPDEQALFMAGGERCAGGCFFWRVPTPWVLAHSQKPQKRGDGLAALKSRRRGVKTCAGTIIATILLAIHFLLIL